MCKILLLRFRKRRAVSTMIGGIIVLSLFLTALATMVLVSQQYDNYQQTVNSMSQIDINRFSENLQFVNPGIPWPPITPVSCQGAGNCDQLKLIITNLAGIGTQIARIYVTNATSTTSGCSGLCVLDPSASAKSTSFDSHTAFINPSEGNHTVTLWFPVGIFSNQAGNAYTISVVTSRGRVFSFTWPIPTQTASANVGGYNVGCFGISFDSALVTETTPTQLTPQVPVSGGWHFPGGVYVLWYFRLANLCASTIKMLDRSVLFALQFGANHGGVNYYSFYVVAPMSKSYHDTYFPSSYWDPAWPTSGNTAPTSNGQLTSYNGSLSGCSGSNPCYNLPPGASQGQPGQSVYVLFSATNYCLLQPSQCFVADKLDSAANLYAFFLDLYYVYQGYEYGVTIQVTSSWVCQNC